MQDVLITFAKFGDFSKSTIKVPRYDPNYEQRGVFGDSISVEKISTEQVEFLRAHPPMSFQPGGK
jgi:hypothetical protein